MQKSKVKTKNRPKRGPRTNQFVLNCVASQDMYNDWSFGDASGAEFVSRKKVPPKKVDLRAAWWPVRNQGKTGACVGFATADGLLRWLYVKEEMMSPKELTSPRFIWMANKETDNFTSYPTSFLEMAGTSTKLALKVAKKYGCVPENMLPMTGKLNQMSPAAFFSVSSQYRINAYYNLMRDESNIIDTWKTWIARRGPILTRLDVDDTWKKATVTDGFLEKYNVQKAQGGHAVCLVGYDETHFIVRNSWGDTWGDDGFAYASYAYAKEAFTEAYGAVLNRLTLTDPKI